MIARRIFNHTGAGLLAKFLSRNNDLDGYWALGVLSTEARASANRVELDMLSGNAHPASPACLGVARTWALHLRVALTRHGVSPEALAAATITIEFGLMMPKRPPYIPYGEPFQCTLHLLSSDGRAFTRDQIGYCMPHEIFPGRRSTRRES